MTTAAASTPGGLALDHLVVAARSLDEGRVWCEATFGVAPEAGGKHALMATHNVVLDISGERFANAYLEIIAIDPDAPPPGRPRWFDLDSPPLQAALAHAPQLVHWVARCADIDAAVMRWRAAGIDPGEVLAAERMAPRGVLRWRIGVPVDGRRRGDGAVPLVIEWTGPHPVDAMPARGVALESLRLGVAAAALDDLGRIGSIELAVPAAGGEERSLVAVLDSPRGHVRLAAPSLASR